jgi:hypothetical protein
MWINAVDLGYTATARNGHRCTEAVEHGTNVIVQMAQTEVMEPSGTFVDSNRTVPW